MGRILIEGHRAGRVAQIFSTMRTPLAAASEGRAVEGQADLIDDAGEAEQVLRVRHRDIRIAQEVAGEDVLGRIQPGDAGSQAARGGPPGHEEPDLAPDASGSADPDRFASLPAWSSFPCRDRPGKRTVFQVPWIVLDFQLQLGVQHIIAGGLQGPGDQRDFEPGHLHHPDHDVLTQSPGG